MDARCRSAEFRSLDFFKRDSLRNEPQARKRHYRRRQPRCGHSSRGTRRPNSPGRSRSWCGLKKCRVEARSDSQAKISVAARSRTKNVTIRWTMDQKAIDMIIVS